MAEKEIWELAYQLFQGVEYIHSNKVIHRDIKPQNVFLTSGQVVKIGDFGVSKQMQDKSSSVVGTPMYLAPEQVQHHNYDFKADIWQAGCIVYYLSCLEAPFSADNISELHSSIVNRKPKPIPSVYSIRLRTFIDILL